MAHVREVERKTGTAYEVRWKDLGKERQRTFTVKRDAERYALKVENERTEGNGTAPLAGRGKTVAEVVAASLAASKPKLKPGTHLQYVHLYETRVLPAFGKKRIANVTSEEVERWVAALVTSGKASSTVRNHFNVLN